MVVSSRVRQRHLLVQFQELGDPSGFFFPVNVRLDLWGRWKQSRVQLSFDRLRSDGDSANQREYLQLFQQEQTPDRGQFLNARACSLL